MRRKLAQLGSLPREQRPIVLASLVLLPAVQISLRFWGLKRTAQVLGGLSDRLAVDTEPKAARLPAEAVGLVAGRSVIGAPCLGRSLVLWFLLRRRGIDAEIVVGTEMPRGGVLLAHAWVEVAGEPVNDALDVRERFGTFELELPRLARAEHL